ncbi:hypothetical protein CS0771_31580 [Catellatospora sp. IY07-71]|uniref:alpha/beta hydrolase fold domain-containing protein n=1 Tax=Catellatospora sp. IY07-71 TaxID=2728827 RepID=UPI001BB52739|nr:alpha/beta hydrolase fold domain-containing protein [Catellatospora sp. IY07-71]BCJ73614.1 hypothetical protein CS0771_31580 [Catellatospora sp. IY07-71]
MIIKYADSAVAASRNSPRGIPSEVGWQLAARRTLTTRTAHRRAALTAKQNGDVPLAGQVLFCPVTDASFDTGSYQQFAEGYFLRRDAMQWFWDQFTPVEPARWPTPRSVSAPASALAALDQVTAVRGELDPRVLRPLADLLEPGL